MATIPSVPSGPKPPSSSWTGNEWRRRGSEETTAPARGTTPRGRGGGRAPRSAGGGGEGSRGGRGRGGRSYNEASEVTLAGFKPGAPLPSLKPAQPVKATPPAKDSSPSETAAARPPRRQRKPSTSAEPPVKTATLPTVAGASEIGLGPRPSSRRKRNRKSSTVSKQSLSTKSSISSLAQSRGHPNMSISASGPSKDAPPHLTVSGDVSTPMHSSASDINQLVERVRAMAMEHNRPMTPGSAIHIDWAGDDDDDSLPDLDDWGVNTSTGIQGEENMVPARSGHSPPSPARPLEFLGPDSPATPIAAQCSQLRVPVTTDGKLARVVSLNEHTSPDAPKPTRRERLRDGPAPQERVRPNKTELLAVQLPSIQKDKFVEDTTSPTTPKPFGLSSQFQVSSTEVVLGGGSSTLVPTHDALEPYPSAASANHAEVQLSPSLSDLKLTLAKPPSLLHPSLPAKPVAAIEATKLQTKRVPLPPKPSFPLEPTSTPSPVPAVAESDEPAVSLPTPSSEKMLHPKQVDVKPPNILGGETEPPKPSEPFTTKTPLPEPLNLEKMPCMTAEERLHGPLPSPSVSLPAVNHTLNPAHNRAHTVGRHETTFQPFTAPPSLTSYTEISGRASPAKEPLSHRSKPTSPTVPTYPHHHHARAQSSPVGGAHRRGPASTRPVISVDAIARLTKTLGGRALAPAHNREQGAVSAPASIPATD